MSFECASKERFPSHERASAVATRINDRKRRQKRRGHARAYRCESCKGWHLFTSEGIARHWARNKGYT